MADKLDVTGRLAEARPAVDNTQCYVLACHLLDYQNPDLTMHPAQVRDWFASEEGMDLHALDADGAALRVIADAAQQAASRQRDQLAGLSGAWRGSGGASAQEFLNRHCEAAAAVAASVRSAAESVASLRDALWQIVDTKAAGVTAIDDRRQADRPAWLAAAQTVITNIGDRATASELVDQQIKPFVDNDIRVDWLNAVRSAIASIGQSYDAAIAGLTSQTSAQFGVPGDFGPEVAFSPRVDDRPLDPTPPSAAPSAPPSMAPSAAPPPASAQPFYPSPPVMTANPPGFESIPPVGPGGSAPSAAPTMPASPLGQLDGLGQRVADALGQLLPSSIDDKAGIDSPGMGDPGPESDQDDSPAEDGIDDHNAHNDDNADNLDNEDVDTDDGEPDCSAGEHTRMRPPEPVDGAPPPAPTEPPPATEPPSPAEAPPPVDPPPADPPPEPMPPPAAEPPAGPPPPADPAATPCEIAGDELPQAGQ